MMSFFNYFTKHRRTKKTTKPTKKVNKKVDLGHVSRSHPASMNGYMIRRGR